MPKIPESIGNMLRGLAGTLFWSIVHVIDALISAATGGLYKDAISRLISGEDLTAVVVGGLVMAATDLIETTESTIISAVSELENRMAAAWAEFLGLTDLQKRIAESLQLEIEAITGKWEAEAEEIELAEEAAARELAKRTIRVLSDRAQFYQDQYSVWMGRFIEMEEEEEVLRFDTSIAGLEMAQHMLDIDVTMIHDLAQERNVAAVIGMTTEIEESLKTADDWVREVAVKPLAYGDMATTVLANFLAMTPEEMQEDLKAFIKASYEAAGSLIPTYAPEVKE